MKSIASLGALFLLAACPGERALVGDGEGSVPLATDDTAYLVQLGLIRGHLRVGYALLEAGADAAAATHSKHPSDELYADLEDAFTARGKPGFAATRFSPLPARAGPAVRARPSRRRSASPPDTAHSESRW